MKAAAATRAGLAPLLQTDGGALAVAFVFRPDGGSGLGLRGFHSFASLTSRSLVALTSLVQLFGCCVRECVEAGVVLRRAEERACDHVHLRARQLKLVCGSWGVFLMYEEQRSC